MNRHQKRAEAARARRRLRTVQPPQQRDSEAFGPDELEQTIEFSAKLLNCLEDVLPDGYTPAELLMLLIFSAGRVAGANRKGQASSREMWESFFSRDHGFQVFDTAFYLEISEAALDGTPCSKCGRPPNPPSEPLRAAMTRLDLALAIGGERGELLSYQSAVSGVLRSKENEHLLCECDRLAWDNAGSAYAAIGGARAWELLGVTVAMMQVVAGERGQSWPLAAKN